MTNRPVEVEAVVQRKDESLPRFVVVPSITLEEWDLTGTTPVDAAVNGVPLGRRNLKKWGRGRDCWFLDLTRDQCARAAIDTGHVVRLTLERAPDTVPVELSDLVANDAGAADAWRSLSPARRRAIADHVRGAKRSDTRARRAARLLGCS